MRPIDADKLKEEIKQYHDSLKPRYISKLVDAEIADIQDIVDEAPTVEAEPVAATSDCETCRQKKTCPACIPTIRRINCPLWRGKV